MPPRSKELRDWLAGFPVEDVREEVAALEEEVGKLEDEIRYRRRLLEVRDQALGIEPETSSNASNLLVTDAARHNLFSAKRSITDAWVDAVAKTSPPGNADLADSANSSDLSRAQKLLRFLDAHRGETWKLSDIRDRLIADGLIEDSATEIHGLQVEAARLARNGRLQRPGPGLYRLPIDSRGGDG